MSTRQYPRRWLWPGLALLLAALAAWPLLAAPGLVNTRAGGDSPFLLLRLYELRANLRAGVFPARWMPDAAYGLGYPFFSFYASLPYYLAALLSLAGAGYLWALKLTQLLGFLGAATAMYALADSLFDDRPAACLAAVAYTLAPFHMVNVYVRGDSLSEFYAFIFYPLILWSILRLRRAPTLGRLLILALSYAGLMVTHNISALIFTPLAGVVLLWTVFIPIPTHTGTRAWEPALLGTKSRLGILLLGAAGFILGAALSAWFWLPALGERSAASLDVMTTGFFHYSGHFRGLNLVQPSLSFDYSTDGQRTPFVMGGLQALLTLAGLAVLAWRQISPFLARRAGSHARGNGTPAASRPSLQLAGLLLLLLYAVWPITPSSALLWARLPLLQMTQFPWRFLSLTALASALVAAAGLHALRPTGLTFDISRLPFDVSRLPSAVSRFTFDVSRLPFDVSRLTSAVSLLASAVLALSALALLRPEVLPLRDADVTPARLQLYEHLTGNIGSTVRAEYLPPTALPRPYTSAALLSGEDHPAPVAAQGALTGARLVSSGPIRQEWQVSVAAGGARLVFQTYAFPGWRAAVDGQPAGIDPALANGRIALAVAEGEHRVSLRLGRTPLRRAAELLSLAAGSVVLALGLAALLRSWRARRLLAATAAFGLALLLFGALGGALAARSEPASGAWASETMDFLQMPYLHPNPQGLPFGSATRLLGYELSSQDAHPGDILHLRLHWQPSTESGLRVLVRLTSAAEPLYAAPSLATSEAPLAAVSEHQFTIPPELAPGLALLAVEVRGSTGLLAPHSAQGNELGTTFLAPVRVRPPSPSPSPAPLGRIGDRLDLLAASASQPRPEALSLRLTWRAVAPLVEDYVASVRLLDPDGALVVALDRQPRYDMYPTSLWPLGSPVADYYELSLPRGTPPGAGYQVEVVLYRKRDQVALGSLRLPNVTLTEVSLAHDERPLYRFQDGLALVNWGLERGQIEDGEEVIAGLQWALLGLPQANPLYRLSLRDGLGREVAAIQAPLSPRFPVLEWPRNALVNSRLRLGVPAGTPPGSYQLALELLGADGTSLGTWSPAGSIEVKPAGRRMTLPAFAHPVGCDFAGLIRLAGYDSERSGDRLAVTLHWQALQAPGRDYKVFLHCYDPATDKIVAQRDTFSLDNRYPSGRWIAGEAVSDRLVLDMAGVAPGRYQLAVGWYDPLSEARLEPSGDPGRISSSRVLLTDVSW